MEIFTTLTGKVIFKLKGIELGPEIHLNGLPLIFRCPESKIYVGKGCRFVSNTKFNLIGVNRKCIISTLAKGAVITIGDYSGFSGVSIGAANEIIIGSNVMVGANSLITDTNWHSIDPKQRNQSDPNPGKIIIEDNVFIGYGCIILKNTTIGENSVIGAGSVVTGKIPANVIAAGNPCKVIKSI